MYRFAQEQLAKWKSAARRKPLIVRGARQVGKTWLIRRFAAAEFDSLVEVDLEKRRDLHGCFGDDLDAGTVIRQLELDSGTRIAAGRTLLFLDEVQACPRAIRARSWRSRYLYEQRPDDLPRVPARQPGDARRRMRCCTSSRHARKAA